MKNKDFHTELIKSGELLNEKGNEKQAEIILNKILEQDPENLDAHILISYCYSHADEKSIEHLKYVLDKNINYCNFSILGNFSEDYTHHFLQQVFMRSQSSKRKDRQEHNKWQEMFADYSLRLLKSGKPAFSYYLLLETLLETNHYQEIIDIGLFLLKKKSAKELGLNGLDKMHDYENEAVLDCVDLIIEAYFLLNQYEEACEWIYELVKINESDSNNWYLFGKTLYSLGYPEESARCWIIAVFYGKEPDFTSNDLNELANIICDSKYYEKIDLYRKLNKIKEKIKEDKKEIFAEIEKKTNESLYNNDLNILSKHYIESKLDIKLPEDKNTGYLKNVIYIPRQRSRHPIVKKAIQFIDDNIKKRTSQFDKQNKNREKEKVRIGAATTPSRDGAILTQYGIDLTAIARNNQAPPIMGRENEIEQMTRILVRREKNNPVLLGEAGVGKTAIVMGLAQRIAAQDVPEILQNRRIIELNVGVLVAGTTYRGDFEKRINQIIKDVKNDPGIILFIDELHTLIGAGSSRRSLDASNILKPALAQGAMRLIGATTTGEYARSVEQDPALERRFSCIWVNEIDRRQTLEVLKARKQKWKEHHGVIISDDVLKQAVLLTDTQIKDRHLPDKAIDLIDESCSLARTTFKKEPDSQNPKSQTLTNNHIQKVLDKWTGAALAGKTRLNTFEYIKKIKQQLKEYIIGHDKLLDDLALIIAYKKMGVNKICDSGIFYFWGQPDTGKSECAKAMANILWPKENGRFLFINLELYNDEYSIAGLKGTPGSNETGILSLQLKHNPHSVIYLHNFHLAHTGVITFFNNLFREGCFSDSSGRNVFTQNAIFILSMSVTQESGHIGFTGSKPETKMDITTYLKKYNIPDSITESIQKVFWFDPLNEHNLRTLMEKKLDSIRQQPFVADFEIEFDKAFINELVGKYKNNPMNHRSLDMLFNREVFPYIIDQLNE